MDTEPPFLSFEQEVNELHRACNGIFSKSTIRSDLRVLKDHQRIVSEKEERQRQHELEKLRLTLEITKAGRGN